MLEKNKYYHGDAMDLIRHIDDNSIDVYLSDIPYGANYQSNRRVKTDKFNVIANDNAPFIWWFYDAYRTLKEGGRMLIFIRWDTKWLVDLALRMAGFDVKGEIIWVKNNHGTGDLRGTPAPQHETIVYATKGRYEFQNSRPKSIIHANKVPSSKLRHPTEKPLELIKELLGYYTVEGELICDPCAGSGVTLEACEEMGRDCIAFELEEEHILKCKAKSLDTR